MSRAAWSAWRPAPVPTTLAAARGARTRGSPDPGAVRQAISQGLQERLPRRGGDCRGSAAPDHAVRAHRDARADGPPGPAQGALTPGASAHGHHQPDPRLPDRAWHYGAAATGAFAQSAPRYPRGWFGRTLASHPVPA